MRTFDRPIPIHAALAWAEKRNAFHLMFAISKDGLTCHKLGGAAKVSAWRAEHSDVGTSSLTYSEACSITKRRDLSVEPSNVVDTTTKAPQPAQAPTVAGIGMDQVVATVRTHIEQSGDLFAGMVQSAIDVKLDRDAIQALIRDTMNEVVSQFNKPNIVEVRNIINDTVLSVGLQHKNFPKLLKFAQAKDHDGLRLNIFLVGPAGTGKTTASRNVAKALGLAWGAVSSLDVKFELTGYRNAAGDYISTVFRGIWENGGVFTFDEISGSSEQALLAFNAGLANGVMPFPDRIVDRHPDCIIIAGDNVFDGANSTYSARNKLDAATLDRFVKLDWPIDEDLESAMAGPEAADWLTVVRAARRYVTEKNIKGHLVTPRAVTYGKALIAAGATIREAAEATLQKGMPDKLFNEMMNAIGA